MPPWNQSPAALQPKVTPTIQTVDAIANVVKLVLVALVAGLAAYHRVVFLVLAPAPARVRLIADLLLWGVSAVTGVRALNTAYIWKSTRNCQVAQDRLMGKQRQLMGLPPTPSQPITPAAVALKPYGPLGTAAPQPPAMSPPLRYARTTQGQVLAEPAPTYAAPAATTPLTAGSTGLSRPSPRFGSAAVATPQQLRSYLDGLEVASAGRAGQAASAQAGYGAGGTPGAASLGAFAVSQPYFGGTPASTGYAATPTSVRGAAAGSTPAPLFSAFHEMPTPTTSGMGGARSDSSQMGTPSMTSAGAYTTAGYAGVAAEAPDVAASPALPFGVELPKYRPSWLPRAKAASAGSQQEVTEATGQQEAAQFLWDVCKVKQGWMEVWTERLREWFAARVLQSLVMVVETAHEGPNALLRKHGQVGACLPSLPSVFEASAGGLAAESSGAGAAGAGGRAGAGGGLAGTMAGGGMAQQQFDIEASLRQVQHLANMMLMNAAMPAHAATAALQQEAKTLAEGVMRYEQLLLLLRGRRPAELLPPAPPGYLWARAQQLAQGTCIPAYNWNGGGAWAGRLWSADLPTDSQLLLYLFAAFIDAPGWEFGASTSNAGASAATLAGTAITGVAGGTGALGGTPLFLGTVRTTRPPPNYSAILAYRPERPGRGVDAVLALSQQVGGSAAKGAGPGGAGGLLLMPGTSTLFCFLAQGRLLALAGHNALFHALIAFMTYHKAKYNNALGGHYLQDAALQLDAVIEPPKLGAGAVATHSVFGWWFPPRTHHKHD